MKSNKTEEDSDASGPKYVILATVKGDTILILDLRWYYIIYSVAKG